MSRPSALRLRRRLADERGIALVMVLGILLILSIALTGIIYATGTNSRSSSFAKSEQVALGLAEAGLNNALAVVFNPENDVYLDDYAFLENPTTTSYAGGTVTWSGSLTLGPPDYWTITATGAVANPTGPGAADVRQTLTLKVPLRPPPEFREALEIWNWIYTHRVGNTCDMTIDQSVKLQSPIYVRGNLCLRQSAEIVKGPMVVGGQLTLQNPQNAVGSNAARIQTGRVGNGCQYKNFAPVNPCVANTTQTNVWVNDFQTSWDDYQITLPPVYWAAGIPAGAEVGWYEKASPGPYFKCTTTSGTTPAFDTTTVVNGKTVPDGFNNSVPGVFNLAPPGQSYTCVTRRGQLSWNHATRELTVRGTIFIDGSAKIENNAGPIRYVQQSGTDSTGAVIYLGGTLLIKNSIVCGTLDAAKTNCDQAAWNPNTNLLVFATYSTGGQLGAGKGVEVVSSTFQGALFARGAIDASTTSVTQGPLVSEDEVRVGQTNGVDFPDVTVTPVGMPGFGPEFYTALDPEYG